MFNRKQKEIDRLNARCKDLAKMLKNCDLKVEQRDILIKDYENKIKQKDSKITDLEANIEFLTNKLTAKSKKELIQDRKSGN